MGDDEAPDYGEPDYGDPEYGYDDYGDEPDGEMPGGPRFKKWPRDPKLDPAKVDLIAWFDAHPTNVFYGRQLEVILEKKYFHWITHKALKELSAEGSVITSELRTTTSGSKLRLYWAKRNRYWKRAANEIVNLVEAHSEPDLTKAIGHHAESVFAVEAARAHFRILGKGTREFNGRVWPLTEHDLDWIFERDGVACGVELKNTWAYIDKAEMDVKIRLCSYLGLRPLFIMRWTPKSYIEIIRKAGGFGLLFEQQLFPVGHSAAVEQLRGLFLPVISPTEVPPGTFSRFVRWHEKGLQL